MGISDYFVYDPKINKKNEFEPEPLYIELGPPPQIEEASEKEDSKEIGIIIIDIL